MIRLLASFITRHTNQCRNPNVEFWKDPDNGVQGLALKAIAKFSDLLYAEGLAAPLRLDVQA